MSPSSSRPAAFKPEKLAKEIMRILDESEPDPKKLQTLPAKIERLIGGCRGSGHGAAYYLNRAREKDSGTALILAASLGEPAIVTALLKAGMKPGAKAPAPYTGSDSDIVHQMLANCYGIGRAEGYGPPQLFPLTLAVDGYFRTSEDKYLEVTRLLLKAGAAVNQVDKTGRSALMRACFSSQKHAGIAGTMLDLLLQAGADPLKSSNGGETSLMWAVTPFDAYGKRSPGGAPSLEVVALLLQRMIGHSSHDAGTGVWAKTAEGQSAVDLLKENNYLTTLSKRALAAKLIVPMFSPASWQGSTLAALEAEWRKLPRHWRALGAQAMLETRRTLSPLLARPRLSSGPTPVRS